MPDDTMPDDTMWDIAVAPRAGEAGQAVASDRDAVPHRDPAS